MNLNSQYEFYPPQPDNPTDEDRHRLLNDALTQKGWPEDMDVILERMAPPLPITTIARPGSFRGRRVGVIGGGLAGLSAAYELRKMGFDITVFDALTDRIGGRVYTYYYDISAGLFGEFGPMCIPVSHETVWHYLREFRLKTYPFIQYNPRCFIYLKNIRVRNDTNGRNVQKHIYPHYDLSPQERTISWQQLLAQGTDSHLRRASIRERSEILEVRTRYSQRALGWINNSSLAMMEEAGLSQGAINLVSNFIPLLEGNLYNSFIDYIQESYPADVSYLYAIEGGTAFFPAAFYRTFFDDDPYPDLSPGLIGHVTYKPGCIVNGIALTDGGSGVTLRYENLSSHERLRDAFDYIVCAIPFSTLRNIDISPQFSGIKMRAIREVNYTASQKTIVYFSERFWERQGIAGGPSFTDLPIGSIWYPSDHTRLLTSPYGVSTASPLVIDDDIGRLPAAAPGVVIGAFNFNLDTTRLLNQPAEFARDEVIKEIAAVHGVPVNTVAAAARDIKSVNWNQEPTFRGALSFFTPEQKRIFAYGMTVPEYGGRVFFAGEHISAVHRWMQGALQTGMQAANDLVGRAAEI